jgi:hypothetical protein
MQASQYDDMSACNHVNTTACRHAKSPGSTGVFVVAAKDVIGNLLRF